MGPAQTIVATKIWILGDKPAGFAHKDKPCYGLGPAFRIFFCGLDGLSVGWTPNHHKKHYITPSKHDNG
jgi:hypothetical protein